MILNIVILFLKRFLTHFFIVFAFFESIQEESIHETKLWF
jgi:hypothetical protein